MNKTILHSIFCVFLFAFSCSSFAQVTIGSIIKPTDGALLDLKENAPDVNNVTSTKGLRLPRVELTDMTNLFPMFSDDGSGGYKIGTTPYTKATEDIAHTGLMVYNVNKCIGSGMGLYVWYGTKWQPLHKENSFVPTLSQTYFDLPSGRDARGAVSAQDLIVNWSGTPAGTWATAADGGLTAVGLTSPSASGTLGASPYTMSILPTAMTATEVTATNPWYSKQTKLTFTNECGQQDYIILNQTNYALKVNNQFHNTQITYKTPLSGNIPVQGNAAWKTVIRDPDNVLDTTTITASGGQDIKNSNGSTPAIPTESFTFKINSRSRYHTAMITFQDTASVKRFEDISVSITMINCNTNDGSIEDWARRAGFSQAEINAVKAGTAPNDGGKSSRILANGIQMHRQTTSMRGGAKTGPQIFLSSNFGANPGDSDERWMIHNLDAVDYDGITHSALRTLTGPNYNTFPFASNTLAAWGYPGKEVTLYQNRERLGILYTWDAATAGKGGANGESNVDNTSGGTAANDETGYPEGNAPGQQKRRQGICPSGWHLPSDYEFTKLETAMSGANSINFSTTANATPATTLGKAWREICERFEKGTSNVVNSSQRPGFNILLAGYARSDGAYFYEKEAYLWSSSSGSKLTARLRELSRDYDHVRHNDSFRYNIFSVRCKKD